jgi:hypothetical protein
MLTIIILKRRQDEDFLTTKVEVSILNDVGFSDFYYSTLQHNELARFMIISASQYYSLEL